jgi:hypothetical protein
MSRAATIALAFLLALAGAFVHAPRETTAPGAGEACASAPCCGGECQCGDDCACMVDEAPDAPRDDAPALPERSRGERCGSARSWLRGRHALEPRRSRRVHARRLHASRPAVVQAAPRDRITVDDLTRGPASP